jgi:hypothetical protein
MDKLSKPTFESLLSSITIWDLLGAIVLLAAVSMAFLQLINDLLPVRAIFHNWRLRKWIRQRAATYEQFSGKPKNRPFPVVDPEDARIQLISHSTGGNPWAFLGLPTDQLVAQINAASQIALEYPRQNFSLLAVLSQMSSPYLLTAPSFLTRRRERRASERGEPKKASKEDQMSGPVLKDLDIVYRYVPSLMKAEPKGEGDAPSPRMPAPPPANYLDARNRLSHTIQRNLDGLQIILTNNSLVWTQLLAIVISIILIPSAWWVTNLPMPSTVFDWPFMRTIGLILLVGVAAGYVAPMLGDIVAAIRRLGRR